MKKQLLIEKLLPGEAAVQVTTNPEHPVKTPLLEYAGAMASSATGIAPVDRPVTESSDKQPFYYLRGIFMQGEIRNRNGRIYPKSEIKKAVETLQEKIKISPVPGELDHPDDVGISFHNIAVAINDIRMDGNNAVGEMVVVPGGLGLILEAAIKVGIKPGVSSRGTGEVDSRGYVHDYEIITIDAVIEPSSPNAYPESLREQIERYRSGREAMKLLNEQADPSFPRHFRKAMKELFTAMRDDVKWR